MVSVFHGTRKKLSHWIVRTETLIGRMLLPKKLVNYLNARCFETWARMRLSQKGISKSNYVLYLYNASQAVVCTSAGVAAVQHV